MKSRKSSLRFWLLCLLGAILLAGLAWFGSRYYIILQARRPEMAYDPGAWFEIAPEGAVTGKGEPLSTRMRVGAENKVIVFFYGGGISYDAFTAARPYLGRMMDTEPGFYADSTEGSIPDFCELGIGSRQQNNPFRDWSIVVIPYTTGDFHIGTADFSYTALDGTEKVLHQHGYDNYRAILDEAVTYTGNAPEELLIAGWSAGGYGAAILAEELMTDYFPGAEHVTVCVDSSLLILDSFSRIAREVWQAPDAITEKIRTDNLVVDFLSDLYDTYGDEVTYLYIGSVRDGALAKYQCYFDTGVYGISNRFVWVYTNYLRQMISQLRENIPSIGIYLFDRLPFSWIPWMSMLTQHTILETQTAYWNLTAGRSPIRWLYAAVNGQVDTVGLEKLR